MAFEKVALMGELNPSKNVSVKDKDLALFKIEGKVYCIDNKCTHAGGPLADGQLEDNKVTCPWHNAQFDVCSGEKLTAPAMENVKSYAVNVEGEEIFVDVGE